MIDEPARAHILARLRATEAEEGVRILYAAESGSRAWGFASPDSDYDVRFIYVHPLAWYLRLVPARDVIERPLDATLVDLAGWDARKALQLLLRSNPTLHEWLTSPFTYIDDGTFRPAARSLFERHASPVTLAHHYASIAGASYARTHGDRERVNLKRYFYVLRPLLCLAWVIARHTCPPMHMTALLAGSGLPSTVEDAIAALIEQKRSTPELGEGARIAVLDEWIDERLAALDPARHALPQHDQTESRIAADVFFRSLLGVSG